MKSSVYRVVPSDSSSDDFICIAEIGNEAEVAVLKSLLERDQIQYVVQGHHHHNQLGFMGPYVKLRLLIKAVDFDKGGALIDEYIERYNQDEFILDEEDGYVPYTDSQRNRFFSDKTHHMGIALILGSFLGFGTACLYARRFIFTFLFAVMNVSIYFDLGLQFWTHSPLFESKVDPQMVVWMAKGCDIAIAWVSILLSNTLSSDSSPQSKSQEAKIQEDALEIRDKN